MTKRIRPEQGASLDELKGDLTKLVRMMRSAGVPSKLITSIERKCLRTPRRQTGRVDRRTNRNPRWSITDDHPDYSSELDAHLVRLRLFIGVLLMQNAPRVDRRVIKDLAMRYLGAAVSNDVTTDPLTDEPLDFDEVVEDVVNKPTHGFSRFHIGHQDPRFHPKHLHQNVRWQLKTSNDFQTTMDIRVARIAFKIDGFTRGRDKRLLDEATKELEELQVAVSRAAGLKRSG